MGGVSKWIGWALASPVFAPVAAASPWVQPKGETYARLAYAREEVSGLDASRWDIYAKTGLSDAWSLTGKLETLRFDGEKDFDAEGYRLTLRRGFRRDKTVKVALEGGLVGGAAISGFAGCEGLGGELRVSVGGGWRRDTTDSFAFVDLVTRRHKDDCHRHRLEVGYGQTFNGKWQLISQFWLERGSDGARSDKSEISLTRKNRWADLTLAYRYEFSGLFQERSVVVAVSREF